MKILHCCLAGPVTDNWTYQDNLLPKYHKKLGCDVAVITSKYIYDTNGKVTIDKRDIYENENEIKTIRLKTKNEASINAKFKRFVGLYKAIEDEKPDIIFVHGIQYLDIKTIVEYIKNNTEVKVYIDNHADFSNSASNWISKNILHKIIWKRNAKRIEPYAQKFYGVSPARVDFLKDVYKLPESKVELLVMGADDEKVCEAKEHHVTDGIRNKYGIKENDFLVMTGGKIDANKKQMLLLMKAIDSIPDLNLKLIVFGSVASDLKEKIADLSTEKVKYIGWVNPQDVYKYFYAADLIVFPGLHSVFWEQAVGLGKPCVFKYLEGFTHIDLDGNCKFLYKDSVDEMITVINGILNDKYLFKHMKTVASAKGMEVFSYEKIARRSIE